MTELKSIAFIVSLPMAAILALLLFSAGCHLLPPPSDMAMETTFHENQKEFEQLRQLITEDSLVGIVSVVYEDRTDPNVEEAFRRGLSPVRLERYRSLLRRLHLRGVGANGHDILFRASATGIFLLKGTYKGYLYTNDPPKPLEKTLDDLGGGERAYAFKLLQEHWYLYYSRN